MNEAEWKKKIDELQERSAFQEQSIEELSGAVTDQWKLINALKKEVERLTEEIKSVEDSVLQGDQREPPPPHY